jgi:hypothetical protein
MLAHAYVYRAGKLCLAVFAFTLIVLCCAVATRPGLRAQCFGCPGNCSPAACGGGYWTNADCCVYPSCCPDGLTLNGYCCCDGSPNRC